MKKKSFILLLAFAMIFTISACKKQDDAETEIPIDETQQEQGNIEDVKIVDVDPEPVDNGEVIDLADFTITPSGYEFSKKEALSSIEAYYYTSANGNMCITQEDFEWTEDDIEEWTAMGGQEVTYGGITGYEANMFGDAYAFSFNRNGRAWQITCDTEAEYRKVIETIKAK